MQPLSQPRPQWLLPILAALALCGPALASAAEPAPASISAATDQPRRGMSMQKVESAYGTPSKRLQAVGQPPISRWEYPGFVVYFENDLVLHTVVKG